METLEMNLEISWRGFSVQQKITVSDALAGISVSGPDKTMYKEGEVIDLTGIEVTALYMSGETKTVTSVCTFSPADGTVINENTILTVSYTEDGIMKTAEVQLRTKEKTMEEKIKDAANAGTMTEMMEPGDIVFTEETTDYGTIQFRCVDVTDNRAIFAATKPVTSCIWNASQTANAGWASSVVKTVCNSIYNQLSDDLKEVITERVWRHGYGTSYGLTDDTDNLWVPYAVEFDVSISSAQIWDKDYMDPFAYYKTDKTIDAESSIWTADYYTGTSSAHAGYKLKYVLYPPTWSASVQRQINQYGVVPHFIIAADE